MTDTVTSMTESPESYLRAIDARATRVETPCGDGTMVWRRWGKGPTLVLFHGVSGSWTHWVRTIGDLSADYTLWIPDLPGNGESAETNPRNDVHAAAAAVFQGIDIILPKETFRVVTFSAGLVLGADVAGRYAERVTQLVAAGAGAVGPVAPLAMRSLRGITDPNEIDAVNRHNLATLMLADPRKVDDLAVVIHKENSRRARVSLRYIDEGAPALVRLKSVQAPIAVIWGGLDAARPNIEHYRQVFNELRPGLPFHVIEGAGHWMMYDAPDRFNATLRGLLARV